MSLCKYPTEVCANMTVLHGKTYCDSVPCSLKDELPKQTNADYIRSMTDEQLAEFLLKRLDNPIMEKNEDICDVCENYNPDSEKECSEAECKNALVKWLGESKENGIPIIRGKAELKLHEFVEAFIYKAVCSGCSTCCNYYENEHQRYCEDYKSYMEIAEQMKGGIENE